MEIILIGGKAGQGKTTAAKYIKEKLERSGKVCYIRSYGSFVKECAVSVYNWDKQKNEKGRTLLQEIGTAGRNYNENTWIEKMKEELSKLEKIKVDYVVIDDCRYENEITEIRKDYHVVFALEVCRKNAVNSLTKEQKTHSSEQGISSELYDCMSITSTLEELYTDLNEAIKHYSILPKFSEADELFRKALWTKTFENIIKVEYSCLDRSITILKNSGIVRFNDSKGSFLTPFELAAAHKKILELSADEK